MSSEARFNNWANTNGSAWGTVIQVQQTIKTDRWSGGGSGTTWYDTGFLCKITPSSASSRILILGKFFLGTNYWEIQGKFTRNGTDIGLGTARSTRPPCGFATNKWDSGYDYYDWFPVSYTYIDAPAVTTPVEYKLWLNPYSTNTVYINRKHSWSDGVDYDGCPSSSITLMEFNL